MKANDGFLATRDRVTIHDTTLVTRPDAPCPAHGIITRLYGHDMVTRFRISLCDPPPTANKQALLLPQKQPPIDKYRDHSNLHLSARDGVRCTTKESGRDVVRYNVLELLVLQIDTLPRREYETHMIFTVPENYSTPLTLCPVDDR